MGSQFHHGYVSRGPPIILDGRVSQVQFETLAFFRGPSQGREVQALVRIRPCPSWFTRSLVARPNLGVTSIGETCSASSEGITPPSSLLPTHAPNPSGFPLLRLLVSFEEALQVATSPCCQRVLPDVISENLSCDAWAPITTAGRLHIPGSSSAIAAFPTGKWVGLP